jgi:aspartyl/asparaginyl-tRNA synthetase
MKPRSLFVTATLVLALLSAACEPVNKLTATKIKDVLDHPRDYENKEITIYGTVTGVASLLFVKFFEIMDETGTMKVVTDRMLPKQGEKLRVTGYMEAIEIGQDRLIVLREKSKNRT